MTVSLNFKPEIEAELLAQAQTSGMIVEEYLLSIVEGALLSEPHKTSSAQERAAAYEAWSANHRLTPPLSNQAVSREAMYGGRGR